MNLLILSSTLAIIAVLVMPGHGQDSDTQIQLSEEEYKDIIKEFRRLQAIFEDPSVPIETKQQHIPEWISFYENNHHLIPFPKEFREKANRTYWMYKNEIANAKKERSFGLGFVLSKAFLRDVTESVVSGLAVIGISKALEEGIPNFIDFLRKKKY